MSEMIRILVSFFFIILSTYGLPSSNSNLFPYSPSNSFSTLNPSFSAQGCFKYKCKLPSQDFGTSACALFEENDSTFYAKPCSDPSTACLVNIDKFNWTCQSHTSTPISFPGDKCSSINDCYGGYSISCTNGICVGKNIGESCTNSYQCNPNSSCRENNGNLQCSPLLEIGEVGCNSEYDCIYNAGCNFTSSGNVCVPYGSISPGTEILIETCNLSENVCSSHICLQKATGDQTGTCTGEISANGPIPILCNSPGTFTTQCISKLDNYTNWSTSSECSCGYNSEGNAYCDLLQGDAPMKAYYRELKKWQESSGIKNCNTVWRYPIYNGQNLLCVENNYDKSSYQSLFYWYLYTNNYIEVIEAEECVLKTFYPIYAEINEDTHGGGEDNSRAGEIALASLLLFLNY